MKRKGKGKKIFSIILCAILIMTNLLPVSVFGAGADDLQVPAYKLTDTLTAGKEYLIVSANSGSGYALTNPGGTSSGASMGHTAVTIESGDVDGDGTSDTYIAADQSNIVWTAMENSSGVKLTNGGSYLEGKSGSVAIYNAPQYSDRGWTYSGSQLRYTGSGASNTYTIFYNSSKFTSESSTSSSSDRALYLFEKAGVVDPPSGDTGDITPGTDNPTVSITPTSSNSPVESVSIEVGETLVITVTNSSTRSPYDFTATLSGSGAAELQGNATVNIAASGTGQFAVKGLADGTVDITIQNNNSSSNRKGTIHLTVGDGGSASVDPPIGDETVEITPETSNPEKSAAIQVGETLVITVANSSTRSGYNYDVTLSGSGVAEIQGNSTVYIEAGSTGQFMVKGLTDGTVDISIKNDNSSSLRKGVIHLTVGDGGTAPVDPPAGDKTVEITPEASNSPEESVSIEVGETLVITVTNSSSRSNYDFTATLNNSGVAEIQGSATVTIAQSGTGQFVVKGLTDGTVDITIQNNNSSSNRKGTIHLTVGDGGSASVDPPSGNTVDITPSTDNPEKTANIDVGDTLVINVTNGSSNSEYDFTATLSNSGVAEIQGSATVTIAKSGTGQITVKGLTDGTVDITIQNNSSYGSQYVRKGVIHLTVGDGGSAPVDPPSGNTVDITPSTDNPEKTANIDVGDTLVINVTNGSSSSAYDFTVTLGSNGAAEIQGNATVNIAAGGTGTFTIKGLADGTVDITIQNSNSYGSQYARKGTIHLTVGEGGSTPVDPPVGDKTVDITPTTDKPEKSASIGVGETLVINVTNSSSNSAYNFTATLSNSGVAAIQGNATVNIGMGSTGQITVMGLAEGSVDITIQNDSSYGDQYIRKGIIHLTVGDGGSAPIDPPSGTGTNIGITSDVHGNVSGLRNWIQAVQAAVDPDLDSMLYCGDFSYNMNNLESFVADYLQVVDATNALVGEGKGVYTSGNHEYYIGNREIPLSDQFTSVPGFVRIGEAVHKSNYIVYCMGAAGWYSGIGTYPEEDIAQLRAYLETAPTNIPIFIPAHFPLHMNSNRTITNADKMIELLNEHPNVIFLWGHNHSQGDSHYGQILTAGDSITYASGKSMEISFTYACAGGMYQESQTQYSGLVANISESGDTVIFQYYRTSTGAPIGSSRTINLVTAPVAGVTLDMSALTLVEGKTATLKAEVAPSNAANKRVNWSSSDSSVVSVTEKGVVKALKEGLATITVTTEEGGFTAECAVTVEPKPVGQGVNIGITSDVHGNLTGLRDWLTAVQDAVNPALDHMLYCGDYSYQTSSLDSYVSDFRDIVSATDELVGEGAGVYTSGNHEYYINGEIPLNNQFISTPGFTRIGEALAESNYIVYCLGASGWYNANGQYPDADVAALRAYLETAPADIPIFIAAHFPLHYFSSRTVTGAENVIDVLNDHPNVIFLWGHNHSQNDSHYGQILTAGDSIEYASGKSKQINFTYANAGGMYQDSQTNYSGLVANVNNAGDTVVFQYYRAATGEPIGQSRTIRIQAPAPVTTYTITAAAGGNGSITPIGQIPVKAGESATFQFNPDEGYEMDTVLIDGTAVTVSGTSYTFENVTANHNIQVSFKAIPVETWGEPTYTWAADNLHVTAERVSSFGNKETETVSAAAVTTDPTCEDQGETVYTAQFENPAFAAQTKTVTTPALGHVWGEAEYTWSEDNSSVTAIRVCTRDAAHVQTETAQAEVNVLHDPTCDTDGEAVYIVFFPLTGIERQTKVDTLPALGHAWGEAEYDWEEDGSSVTATCICERDSDHVVTETVETEEVVIILPTCVTVGRTDFTADFTKPEFTDQTETRSIPALGHIWGEAEYSWAEDYSSVTATHICTREGCTCEETETSLPIQRSISKPTCETAGQVMYIATFDNDAFTIQTEIGLVPALGHAWGEAEYVWSEDNSSVTATRVCTRDGSHTETETADVSMSITKESTCEAEGEAVYTAEFANEAFTAQTKTEVLAKLPHSYGRPVWGWDGYDTAYVILTCTNCGEVKTIQAAITAISVEATCTETGETVYTASVEVNGKTYTDSRREILPMLEHTPGEAVREDEVPATVTAEGSYDEVVYCAVCHAELSRTHKTIDKLPIPLAINIQPYDQTVAAGKTATFTVAASGEGLTYQWQYSNNGGTTWKNKTGATTASYTVTTKASYDGMRYRCKVTDSTGNTVTSDEAKLTIIPKPVITAQPSDQTVLAGKTAAFTVAASGEEVTYQWQYSNDGGNSWHNKTGATATTYTVTAKTSYDGMLYRCKVTNGGGSEYTATAKLTVTAVVAPAIAAQPRAQTAAVGETAAFTVAVSGTGLQYQWQYSNNNGLTWTNKTGSTSATHTVTVKASYNGMLYRCVIKNSAGSVTTEAVRLTVDGVKPKIMTQPEDKIAAAGKTATFEVDAAGTGLTYQWQYSTDGGSTWKNKTGATSASYTVTAKASYNGILYRCRVKNSYGTVYSESAVLTVG